MRNQGDYLSTTAIGRGFVGHEPRLHYDVPELPAVAARAAFEGVLAEEAQQAPEPAFVETEQL